MSEQLPSEKQCNCDLRTRLVGDGCEVCNPELAARLCRPECDTCGTVLAFDGDVCGLCNPVESSN